jgi:glycosyltransferase involved in cell wall biosynthesis
MGERRLDFWGVSYGEHQNDFTGYNKYGVIPIHLQSYFLVIEKSLLTYQGFYDYWKELGDTDSREKAIGKHETVFTKHFGDLGFKHGALAKSNEDSPMYIHPLSMVQEGIPIVKYTAFANYNDDKFAWQGLIRKTEVPELLTYIEQNTDYPMSAIHQIMDNVYNNKVREHILIIDGVENAIPQCTRYRVTNKAEQLRSAGYDVWTVNASAFQMGYAEHASHIIIYRTGYTDQFGFLCQLARKYNKPVYYDIDDLVIDTKYTDQLEYTKTISSAEKANYDAGVKSYGQLLKLCDGAITTTAQLKHELQNYQNKVLINRNLASKELIEISAKVMKDYRKPSKKVKIGYFSGSITHNENFELVKPALLKLLATYSNVELHLVGHLDVPAELAAYKQQVVTHEYVEWHELPSLVSEVDINLAPLVHSIFNEAKSEIKWLEAALVKVPTMASNIGSFVEMITHNENGILVNDNEWFDSLEKFILNAKERERIALSAYGFVLKYCVTEKNDDSLIELIREQ